MSDQSTKGAVHKLSNQFWGPERLPPKNVMTKDVRNFCNECNVFERPTSCCLMSWITDEQQKGRL